MYNQAIDGVKLNVFEKDSSQINGLLTEDYLINTEESYKNERVDGESFGSTNVSFGQITKKRFSLWIAIVSIALFVYPFKVNKCYHCYHCGYEFK